MYVCMYSHIPYTYILCTCMKYDKHIEIHIENNFCAVDVRLSDRKYVLVISLEQD